MEHDVCLNIYWGAPREIQERIGSVYSSMPYWDINSEYPRWRCESKGIDLYGSAEPGGFQIAGDMPGDIWEEWYGTLKLRLTEALGYEIGEPQDGYEFKYWEPFIKAYSDIKSIDKEKIVFSRGETFFLHWFDSIKAEVSAKPPRAVLSSALIELQVISEKRGGIKDFISRLEKLGIKTGLQ